MIEVEKMIQDWESYKPKGTPQESIWNSFIEDARAALRREKAAKQMTDLEKFVDTYEQFGIELHLNEIDGDLIRITLGNNTFWENYKVTESDKFGGYTGFYTDITFDAQGNFLSQKFRE